jgi:hypothetical protein
VDGRTLPTEPDYALARSLLLDFFQYGEQVMTAVKDVPRYGKGKVVVGVLIEDHNDIELFLNSYASAKKVGINKNKFVIFTTKTEIVKDLENTEIKVISLPFLAELGKQRELCL